MPSLSVSADEVPVASSDDVLAQMPLLTRGPNAPVRDAINSAESAMFQSWQESAAYAAAQSDPLRATGLYLVELATDRSAFAQEDEGDTDLRARMLATPNVVTADTILDAANVAVAPYSAVKPHIIDSILDRMFVFDGSNENISFVGAEPSYPSRYFDERPPGHPGQAHPGGGWIFGDQVGRYFVLRVPLGAATDSSRAYLLNGSTDEAAFNATTGLFVSDGSDTGGSESTGTVAAFVSLGFLSDAAAYQAVVNAINPVVGQGVRWQLYADPNL